MKFELTKEEKVEIINEYGGNILSINKVEAILNSLEIINDDDIFKDVVISVISQHETIKDKIDNSLSFIEKKQKHMSLSEIIAIELNRRYTEYDVLNPNQTKKLEEYLEENNKKYR